MAVAALFGGYRAVTRVLWLLLAYNFMCVFFFAAMYSAIDFNAHFVVPARPRAPQSAR